MFFPTSLCGVLVSGCALPPAVLPSSPALPLPSLTTQLTHTQLTRTQLTHTQLTHTHTHTSLTHNLPTTHPHTTYSHTTHTHTQLTHTHTQLTNTQGCCRSFQAMQSTPKIGDSPVQRAVVQPKTTDRSKGDSQAQRAAVQHIDRQGEKGKKANCFTLLKQITKLKCVNSKVRSNVECYSLDRDSPKGSCHLVDESHTCIEKPFEFMSWNVSNVQNNNRSEIP